MERLSDIRTVNSLRDYTEKIKEALAQASNQFIYIGFLLDEADRFEVYQQSGFDSIYDYCETIFGFKRSSTNNFIRVYRQFGEGIGLQEKFSRYSYSQLTEMCSMDRQQISQCAPEMSVRKIRELKQKPVYQQVLCLDQMSDDPVQTSGKEVVNSGLIFPSHYIALELYLKNRFSGKCDFDFDSNLISFVNGTGCDFAVDIIGEGKYSASVMFDTAGAVVTFNGCKARINPACCFYILQRLAGKCDAEYVV